MLRRFAVPPTPEPVKPPRTRSGFHIPNKCSTLQSSSQGSSRSSRSLYLAVVVSFALRPRDTHSGGWDIRTLSCFLELPQIPGPRFFNPHGVPATYSSGPRYIDPAFYSGLLFPRQCRLSALAFHFHSASGSLWSEQRVLSVESVVSSHRLV